MQIVSVSNNKGGSGKTTMTVNLAAAFAERGLRILVVDLDPQGSATHWLHGSESGRGLVEFSAGGIRVSELVSESPVRGVDLIATSASLVPPGDGSRNETGLSIVRAFARLPDYWDLVLIDTPPALGYLSLASLVVSNHVVIPVEAHALGLVGVATVMTSIDRARRHVNPGIELLGIVLCRVRATRHTREIVAQLRAEFGVGMLTNSVREAIVVAEAPALRVPITEHSPGSRVVEDYRAVAAELLGRLGNLES